MITFLVEKRHKTINQGVSGRTKNSTRKRYKKIGVSQKWQNENECHLLPALYYTVEIQILLIFMFR
jgi:hypothetical protein